MSLAIATRNEDQIDAFKRQWPCHGFPDNFTFLNVAFDTRNGDLVEMSCHDENDREIDSEAFDGPALLALVEDAQLSEPAACAARRAMGLL